jgi:hypothetical protein
MTTDDALLFIDANIYLELYRIVSGKSLLAPLSAQTQHIFVTQQIVDEVKRRKIDVAAEFLKRHFIDLKLEKTYTIPDHLFGTTEEESKSIRGKMEEIHRQIDQVNKDLNALALGIMEKISESKDEVSVALTPLFAKAVPHLEEELQRARQRKERGQPPGKKADPIGDQLTWEQILSRFVGRKKLWIITRDSDYGTIYGDRGFLNQLLYEDLQKVSPDAQAFLFGDVASGIKHFADITGVKADNLPSPEQIEEIKKEIEDLPPHDWLIDTGDAAREAVLLRRVALQARSAATTHGFAAPLGLTPAAGTGGVGSFGPTPPAGYTTETQK